MKKLTLLTSFILCLILAVSVFSGCTDFRKKAHTIVFDAVIESVYDTSVLISTDDDGVSFDEASVLFSEELDNYMSFYPAIGQTVRITILPEITEGSPVMVVAVGMELLNESNYSFTHPDFSSFAVRADSCSEDSLKFIERHAQNPNSGALSSVVYLPVMFFDNRAALDAFIEEGRNYFNLNTTYGENSSFIAKASKYDDDYFAENILLVAQASEPDETIQAIIDNKNAVHDATIIRRNLSVVIDKTQSLTPSHVGDVFIFLEFDDRVTETCRYFDAYFE